MTKKNIKKTISDIVNNKPITEGPIASGFASLKGLGAGLSGMARGAGANMRLGQIKSQLNQFVDKTNKNWEMHKNKADSAARKLRNSRDKQISQMGDKIEVYLDTIDDQVDELTDDMTQKLPSIMPRDFAPVDKLQKSRPPTQNPEDEDVGEDFKNQRAKDLFSQLEPELQNMIRQVMSQKQASGQIPEPAAAKQNIPDPEVKQNINTAPVSAQEPPQTQKPQITAQDIKTPDPEALKKAATKMKAARAKAKLI